MVKSRFIDGPTGRLDSRWHGPETGAPVLLLHPHPFHGGTMGTRLIHSLATALSDDGFRAVRFDFRGVGRSEGAYDRGVGETQDAQVVLDALRDETDEQPTVVGFSFGGAVAVRIAGRNPIKQLVCVATPARVRDSKLDVLEDAAQVTCPTHLVYGTEDELVPRAGAEALAEAFATPPHWHILEGADHFLTPTHIPRAVSAVRQAISEQHL